MSPNKPAVLVFGAALLACAVPMPAPHETAAGTAVTPERTPQPPAATPQPTLASNLPVMVGRRVVDPATGQLIKELAEIAAHEVAVPAEDAGQYWLGDTLVDVAALSVVRTRSAEFRLDGARKAVLRVDDDDKPLWTTILTEGVGSVRPPDIIADDVRVYVAVDSGIAVLDRTTGALQRIIKGSHDHLMLYDGRIVAVDCASPGSIRERWLHAYDGATGDTIFSADLPVKAEPETPVAVDGDLLIRGDNFTHLVGPHGESRVRLFERIAAIRATAPGWVVVSDKRIFAYSGDRKLAWERRRFTANFVHEAHILELPGGDLLLYNFGRISDSGVELLRIDRQGKQRWTVQVAPAWVSHSKYRHEAYVLVRGDELVVVSQGSYASFLAVVDAGTGATRRRFSL